MVASALPHLDGPHLRDWSRFDGSERAAALESAWRDLAVSCWKDLHQGEEPAAADLPDPADIAVFIDQESPLLGVAWDEFRVRWEELASRVISRATVREWANLELTIITRDTPGTETEFMVLQADTGKVRHLTAEEWENLPKLKRIGPGRFVSWDDFLSQNIMGAGAAHAQLINDVIDELRGAPGISPDKGAALLMVCDYYEGISPEVRGEHPAVPLIHAWQRTPEAERIRYVKADLRTRRRRMPANLRVGDRSHSQAGGAVQSALFDRGSAEPVGLQGQLPGIRDSGKAPALPLELWDLGAASATKGAGRGAPLPLGVLKAKLYPNDTHINRKVFYERLCRAVEILQSREARIPWYDPTTGKGGLRQVVSITNLPDGPDALAHDVKVVIDLPPNSQAGPTVSDNLGRWGVCSAAAYRALLNLAYQWYEPGRTHYPVGAGGRLHWRRSYDPDRYESLTDADLIALCYPAGISSKQRGKRLAEAKRTMAELADAGELQIISVGTSGRERLILPPLPSHQ